LLTVLLHYLRTAILNELLNNKNAVLTQPSHSVNCLTTHSLLLYPHPTPSYAVPKSGSSFCHTLYYEILIMVSEIISLCLSTTQLSCIGMQKFNFMQCNVNTRYSGEYFLVLWFFENMGKSCMPFNTANSYILLLKISSL
jgi:hypothetical protein